MNKQIEEMAKTVCHLDRTCDQCMTSFECKAMTYAKRFYDNGYRKASEVASEIFAELDKRLDDITIVMGRLDSLRTFHKTMEKVTAEVAELKKKYTEGEG